VYICVSDIRLHRFSLERGNRRAYPLEWSNISSYVDGRIASLYKKFCVCGEKSLTEFLGRMSRVDARRGSFLFAFLEADVREMCDLLADA